MTKKSSLKIGRSCSGPHKCKVIGKRPGERFTKELGHSKLGCPRYWYYSKISDQIITKFGTCHDNIAIWSIATRLKYCIRRNRKCNALVSLRRLRPMKSRIPKFPTNQCPDIQQPIDPSHKSQNASVPYPTMQYFVTEMCTGVHISVTKWCIVGYLSDALWDLWDGSIETKLYCKLSQQRRQR